MLDRPGSQSSVLDVDQPRVVGLDQISRDPQDFALNADLNQLCWRGLPLCPPMTRGRTGLLSLRYCHGFTSLTS